MSTSAHAEPPVTPDVLGLGDDATRGTVHDASDGDGQDGDVDPSSVFGRVKWFDAKLRNP